MQEKDSFKCGRCKIQFEQLSQFIDHKRTLCKSPETPMSDISTKLLMELPESSSLEKTYLISLDNNFKHDNAKENVIQFMRDDQPSENEPVTFLISENQLDIDNSLATISGQIFIPAKIPQENNSVYIANSECNKGTESIIINTDNCAKLSSDNIILSNSVENEPLDVEFFLTQSTIDTKQNDTVILTNFQNISTENNISQNSDGIVSVNDSHNTSQINENLLKLIYEQLSNKNNSHDTLTNFVKIDKKNLNKIKSKLECSFCGKEFEKQFNLQQHERIHTGERPFQCIICGRAFSQKSNVRKHMIRHKVWPQAQKTLKIDNDHTESTLSQEFLDQIDYSCQYCSSSFKSYSQYKKHLSVHSNFKV